MAGVLIFASLNDFEAFVAAAESGALEHGPLTLGAGWLALTSEPATALPPSMRREAMEHGWPVESADAYPLVERRDPDGVPRPLVERDVEIATAWALALGAFFAKHAAMFESDSFVVGRDRRGGATGAAEPAPCVHPLRDGRPEHHD